MTMQYWFFMVYSVIFRRFLGINDIWNMQNSLKAIIMCVVTIFLIIVFIEIYNKLAKNTFLRSVGICLGILDS